METNLKVLSDAEVIQVHERSMSVLASTGVRVDSARARKILKSAGADVDSKTRIVRFPRSMIEKTLKIAPKKFSLGGRRPGWEFKVNDGKCTLLADGAAIYVVDGLTGDRRVAGFDDWLDATRMIDSLDETGVYWSMVEPTFSTDSIGNFVMYWRNMVRNFSKHHQDSEATALRIDSEIKRIVTEQYERATKMLTEHRPVLVRIAEALLEHEVLDAPQLKQLIAGEPLAVKVPAAPVAPVPSREPRAPEEGRPAGNLPPAVADPRPTS